MSSFRFALSALLVMCMATACYGSFIFLRTMPPEGTWAEWHVESNLSSKGVQLSVRLEAGKVVEREDRRFQVLDLSGTWEDSGKPVTLKARYEVDLARLKTEGYPRNAVRLLSAYKSRGSEFDELDPKDQLMQVYRVALLELSDVRIADKVERSAEPTLRGYRLKVLTAKANTRHFGSGQAPTSEFRAWVGDTVPFGVGKWEMTTALWVGQQKLTVEQRATLVKSGDADAATTQPSPSKTEKRGDASDEPVLEKKRDIIPISLVPGRPPQPR